jgi:NAD(P)-dependent dehydrogenase (short-subunit alcohol dehydrogenase family)
MRKLERKIALVTGGNSGIGLATAKQFVNEGAYVFITGRREPELAAAVKEIGSNATAVQGDVSNLSDLDRLFAQMAASHKCRPAGHGIKNCSPARGKLSTWRNQ